MISNELKRGTAELAVLSVLERSPLHGYEIARQIEGQSRGALKFSLAALYPMLYRMESRGWLRGSWETSESGRRRRCYRLLRGGQKMLARMRNEWENLQGAMRRLSKVSHA
jgi:PadR family transcriptional regulator PadR